MMDVDEALEKVGGYRRWHLAVFVLLTLSSFLPMCQQSLVFVFIGWEPPYHCKVPLDVPLNQSLPHDGDSFSKCKMYVNSSIDNSTSGCVNGVHYYNEDYETIVTEFDLVCQSDFLSDMSHLLFVIVQAVGAIANSYLVDRFGRKKIHIISNVILIVLGSSVSFSPNYICFAILRAMCGAMLRVGISAGVTLLMETFGTKHRTVIMMGMQIFWVVTYLFPAMISFFIKDWRIIQLVGSLSSIIWLMHIWFLTESVPWLVVQKRHKEAEKVLRKMAKRNKVKIDGNILKPREEAYPFISEITYDETAGDAETDDLKNNIQNGMLKRKEKEASSVPLRDLFSDPKLRLHLVICNVFWLANTMVYGGLTFISPALGPNRFLNYFLMGVAELPSYITSLFIVKRYGRKIPLMIMFFLTGAAMGIAAFVPKETASGRDLTPLTLILALIGKFGITSSFSIKILFARELFPTTLRSSSDAWGSIGGTIGSCMAPVASYLVRRIYWVPNALFAVSAIIAGLATLALPETKNKPLPSTTGDIHQMYYANRSRRKTTAQ